MKISFMYRLFLLIIFAGCAHSVSDGPQSVFFTSRGIASLHQNVKAIYSNDGSINVSGSGLKSGKRYQINVYNKTRGNKYINQYRTRNNGIFSFTISKNHGLRAGQELSFKILNYKGKKHTEFYKRIVKSGSGNSNPPTRNPISGSRINKYADQQARTVANRVARTYGKLENWRSEFVSGYCSAYQNYKIWEGNGAGRRNYNRGYDKGRREGESQGIAYGEGQAQSDAERIANDNVRQEFQAVVGTDNAPVRRSSIVGTPQFAGMAVSDFQVNHETVTQRLNSELEQETRNLIWTTEAGWTLRSSDPFWGVWGLSQVYTLNCNYIWTNREYFRSSWGYRRWENNDLGGRYNYNLYNKMNYSEKAQFKRKFKSIFSSVINNKIDREVRKRNLQAFTRGQYYGREFGLDESFQNGHHNGIVEGARSQSIQVYNQRFQNFYSNSYQERIRFYDENPVIENIQLGVLDGNENNAFEPGESIGLYIQSLDNVGRKETDLNISLSGGSTASLRSVTVNVDSSSSIKDKKFKGLAKIASPAPNQSFLVQARVGDTTQSFNIRIDWKALVQNYNGDNNNVKTYILNHIRDERLLCLKKHKCYVESKRKYKTTLLYQLMEASSSNGNLSNLRAGLKKIGKESVRGGFWSRTFGGAKKKHERFNTIINRL